MRLTVAKAKTGSAADNVRAEWQAGQLPILDVLDSDRPRLGAEDALARCRTDVRRDEAQLYVVLGG